MHDFAIVKENVSPRLTVSPTRALLKVPPTIDDGLLQLLATLTAQVVPFLRRRYSVTLRGNFHLDRMQLQMRATRDKVPFHVFEFDLDGNIINDHQQPAGRRGTVDNSPT